MSNPTQQKFVAAFTEWDRRFRENPEQFESEAVRLIKGTPQTYGDAAAPYFMAILEEQDATPATATAPAAPAA